MALITRVRQAANVALLVIVILAVLPFIAHTFPAVAGQDETYIVKSGSMEPELSPGDVIWVRDVGVDELREGDIITFVGTEGSRPTTHRIHAKSGSGDGARFVTKGDANDGPDAEVIRPEQVIGEVSFSVPYYGRLILFATTDIGLFTFAIVPSILIILNEGWQLYLAYTEVEDG